MAGIALTYSHDRKTLVDEDTVIPDEATGPVRPTVAHTLRQCDGTRSGRSRIVQSVDTEYSTHFARVAYGTDGTGTGTGSGEEISSRIFAGRNGAAFI